MIWWLVFLATLHSGAPHGFMLHPMARQYSCYKEKDFFWPADGSGIRDDACRSAYQHVFRRHGPAQAQYMFNQYPEYAAFAGPDYKNRSHVREDVVPHTLCGAGADDSSRPFGDKSGVDLPLESWFTTVLTAPGPNRLYFCPTAVHEPSFFEVYISKPNYAYKNALGWDDLDLVYEKPSALQGRFDTKECDSSVLYVMDVELPPRRSKFVLFVRWQREDVVGEGFYNCADAVYHRSKSEL